jgi:hypothetical protein
VEIQKPDACERHWTGGGGLIMKRWLENYVVQMEISAWIYVSILLALFMAIVFCVGGKVYRTSRENPINAIKKINLPLHKNYMS